MSQYYENIHWLEAVNKGRYRKKRDENWETEGTVLRLTSELYPNTGQKDDFTLSTYQMIISTAPYFLFVFILAQEHIDLVYNNQV